MTPGGATIQGYAGQPVTWRSSRTSMTPLAIHAAFTTAGSEARRRSSGDLSENASRRRRPHRPRRRPPGPRPNRPRLKAKVAKEQDAAIARALREDEAHRHADLEEVAVEEAEAVPDWPPEC